MEEIKGGCDCCNGEYYHECLSCQRVKDMRGDYPQLGKYSLIHKLGSGKFAVVKLGEENVFGEQFAIKIMETNGIPKEDYKTCFSQMELEIEVLKTCSHPNIIRMFDHDLDANIHNLDGT